MVHHDRIRQLRRKAAHARQFASLTADPSVAAFALRYARQCDENARDLEFLTWDAPFGDGWEGA